MDAGSSSPRRSPPGHVGFPIRRAQQVNLAVWAEEAGPGPSNVQCGVLNVLHRTGGASQRELCDALDLDRSTVAGLVSRLEARGLVERARAAADRRRNLVRLTQAGGAELRRLVRTRPRWTPRSPRASPARRR